MEGNRESSEKRGHIIRHAVMEVVFIVLIFLTFSLIWAATHFSMVTFGGILFTLRMPFSDAGSDFVNSFIKIAAIPTVAVCLIELILVAVLNKKGRMSWIEGKKARILTPVISMLWLIALIIGLEVKFEAVSYIKGSLKNSDFIENEYVDPREVELTFPEKKRNLIYIFVESAETSIIDKAHGGVKDDHNYIPEMTELLDENVEFSQNELHAGASVAPASGWTMAGMVAEHAGLPMKMWGYNDDSTGKKADNFMQYYEYFMPGMTTIGDILYDQGYNNYFMCGSEIEFGGRKNFLEQHGKYQIFDLESAREEGKIYWTYFVWWGFEDLKLYEYAREKITDLSKEDKPFNFTMLTVDTHHVGGYVCPECNKSDCDEQYGVVWHCASRQVAGFIDWCKTQPWYDDTTIVIAGDHCSMDPDFFKNMEADKHLGETNRGVYNCYINPVPEAVNKRNRKYTTMDIFPTTLAAMGVDIEGDRLGLGTNLFSDRETLSEEYGYDKLFYELNCRSNFYNEKLVYP